MSQSEPGDGANPNLPSVGNREPHGEQTLSPKRIGLPWQFWLWQLLPIIGCFIALPPYIDGYLEYHLAFRRWLYDQSLTTHLQSLIFATWFCQGILLAFWIAWGSGHWASRSCRALSLGILAFSPIFHWCHQYDNHGRSRPWDEVFAPEELLRNLSQAFAQAFLFPMGVACAAYFWGYRVCQLETLRSKTTASQFTIRGLLLFTLGISLVLTYVNWIYPALTSRHDIPYEMISQDVTEEGLPALYKPGITNLSGFETFLSTLITTLLSLFLWTKQGWKPTAFVFSLLFLGFLYEFQTKEALIESVWWQMIAMAISRYWIGWNRFQLIRQFQSLMPRET